MEEWKRDVLDYKGVAKMDVRRLKGQKLNNKQLLRSTPIFTYCAHNLSRDLLPVTLILYPIETFR